MGRENPIQRENLTNQGEEMKSPLISRRQLIKGALGTVALGTAAALVFSSESCTTDDKEKPIKKPKPQSIPKPSPPQRKPRHPENGEGPSPWVFSKHDTRDFLKGRSPQKREKPSDLGHYKKAEKIISPEGEVLLGAGYRVVMPKNLKMYRNKDGKPTFDLWIHFHGANFFEQEWVSQMENTVLVKVDLGMNSGPYEKTFQNSEKFGHILKKMEEYISLLAKQESQIDKLGVSSWSGGYGALKFFLKDEEYVNRINAAIVLDGIHTGYRMEHPNEENEERNRFTVKKIDGPQKTQVFTDLTRQGEDIKGFTNFAELSAQGKKFMAVAHSSVVPGSFNGKDNSIWDYASSTHTANYITDRLGLKPDKGGNGIKYPYHLTPYQHCDFAGYHTVGFLGGQGGKQYDDHTSTFGAARMWLPQLKEWGFR